MPVLPSDLVTIGQVETFLGLQAGAADESFLLSLIAAASAAAGQYCSRDFALQYINELRNGSGTQAMSVINPPIVFMIAVLITGTPQTIAQSDSSGGIVNDENTISFRGLGSPIGGLWALDRFPRVRMGIRFQYVSGWQLPNQGTNDWVTGTAYSPRSTIQPLTNNPGGYIYEWQAKPGSQNLVAGGSNPTFNQTPGSLTPDGSVNQGWTNLGLTSMPSGIPFDLQQAICEWVATRYRQKPRWADTGVSLGPERIMYFTKDMMDSTKGVLNRYRKVTPVMV